MKQIWGLTSVAFLGCASLAFGQYQMDLTGVGDGASAGGVYVSPYNGTISVGGSQIYSGYMICDDFNTESLLNTPWNATASNGGSLDGTEKFNNPVSGLASGFTVQQNYDAVAWLANGLVASANVNSAVAQTNFSFAIWDIFDGASTDPDGGATALITQAFQAVKAGYVATNVTVFTANPQSASQEFLVVNGPHVTAPEPSSAAILGLDLAGVFGLVYVLRRRRAKV